MRNTFKILKDYINYIKVHRKNNKIDKKSTIDRYGLSMRFLIRLEYTFHDLNKIFTPHILTYAKRHEFEIYDGDVDGYDSMFCEHDSWAIHAVLQEPEKFPNIITYTKKYINRLMLGGRFIDFCDELFELCSYFGEDCTTFYLRNYNYFNIHKADRFHVEKGLCISFDDYLHDHPQGLCISEIFDRTSINYDPDFAVHVAYSLMNEFGVNIYDILEVDEIYGYLEEFQDFCEEE